MASVPNKGINKVSVSKSMSYILRHGAEKEKINIDKEGFVLLDDMLRHALFKNVTVDTIIDIVKTNDKQRFFLEKRPQDNRYYIRANQGHTLKQVDELELRKLEDPGEVPMVIHGTFKKHFDSILEKGLCKMERNMIHFAIGISNDVVSGIRTNSNMIIYIDLARAMKDGVEFFISTNNVVLTPGVDNSGVLPSKYFKKITDRNNVAMWMRDVVMPQPK
ncbi:hypothetical protein CYY_001623 [Polysphondylium violaceum]|uniref:2'-phosphotransferase n=1 Tax=Polysphondylium violaceum TaxID=133409 RepID=A0A8J4UW08_9MYCE|nr:hypothetical protein CYY_001623 [Polysphondylium violaceum]